MAEGLDDRARGHELAIALVSGTAPCVQLSK